MAAKTSTEDRIIDAALELAATRGWRGLGLREIAAAADIGLAELYDACPGKDAILDGYARRLDRAVLAGEPPDLGEEAPRDRLFDAVMRRLELMTPHKQGIAAILHDVTCDPLWMACHAPAFLRSVDWLLEAAGLRAAGCEGALRRAGLAAIYLDTLRVWLRDDSPDMARAMAALDRRLRQADVAMRCLARGPRRPSSAPPGTAEAPVAP